MSIVFGLPLDLSSIILSDWLDLLDVGRLDSAVCRNATRSILLDVFDKLLPRHFRSKFSVSFVNWLNLRKLKSKNFHLHKEHFVGSQVSLIEYHRVVVLEVSHLLQDQMAEVNKFFNISSLTIGSSNLKYISSNILEKLTSITLTSGFSSSDLVCRSITQCQHLHHLKIYGGSHSNIHVYQANKDILDTLVKNNSCLETIEMAACMETLNTIVEVCPDIKKISLSTEVINYHTIGKALLHCKDLGNFFLNCLMNGTVVQYKVENDRGRSLTLHDYNGVPGKADLLSSVTSLNELDLEGAVYDADLASVLVQSVNTLHSIKIRRGRFLGLVSLTRMLECRQLHTLVLESSIDDDEILNAFIQSPPRLLRVLSLRTRISASTVLTILRLCEGLCTVGFWGVIEDPPEVHLLVHYLRDGEGKGRAIKCDIEFKGAGLYFSRGRFAGSGVKQYLTEEEIRLNQFYDSDDT